MLKDYPIHKLRDNHRSTWYLSSTTKHYSKHKDCTGNPLDFHCWNLVKGYPHSYEITAKLESLNLPLFSLLSSILAATLSYNLKHLGN